jgi:hypothetical protein
VIDNRVLRRTFGPKREEVTGAEEAITKSFVMCTLHQILFG